MKVSFEDSATEKNYEVFVELSPLDNIRKDSIEWIGVDTKNYSDYSIVSFRIEEQADEFLLLKPNLNMIGHVVLSMGIKENTTNGIIYVQIQLDNEKNF